MGGWAWSNTLEDFADGHVEAYGNIIDFRGLGPDEPCLELVPSCRTDPGADADLFAIQAGPLSKSRNPITHAGFKTLAAGVFQIVMAFQNPAAGVDAWRQVCLSSLGVAFFGLLFSQQSAVIPLILSGFLVTAMGAWRTVAAHGYQPKLYPPQIRARGVGFVTAWGRFGIIFTGFIIAAIFQATGVAGVFTFIAGSMGVVIIAVGLLGPATTGRSLEHMSR